MVHDADRCPAAIRAPVTRTGVGERERCRWRPQQRGTGGGTRERGNAQQRRMRDEDEVIEVELIPDPSTETIGTVTCFTAASANQVPLHLAQD